MGKLARVVLCLLLATSIFAAEKGKLLTGSVTAKTPKLASASGSSNVACYFGTPASSKWKWGLQADNSYYAMGGTWTKTQFTKTMKFFTTTSQSDIEQACSNSAKYYKITDPLFAAFAATSGTGANYPTVSNSVELWPQY